MLTVNDQLLKKENETQREFNQRLLAFGMTYRFARCSNPILVAEQILKQNLTAQFQNFEASHLKQFS